MPNRSSCGLTPTFFMAARATNARLPTSTTGWPAARASSSSPARSGPARPRCCAICCTLPSDKIYAAQIATTQLDADDLLRMVAAAFELPYDGLSKAALLSNIGQLLQHLDRQGKRALLVIDEAQNLSARAVEELRMLSNFQTSDRALLQTFLLGQPEFRKTLMSPGMEQLRQRVTATFHLGPMEEA